MFTYQLISSRQSSAIYGNCEVCHQHVAEVFHQIEGRAFEHPITGKTEITYLNTNSLFGHKVCLIRRQRIAENKTVLSALAERAAAAQVEQVAA